MQNSSSRHAGPDAAHDDPSTREAHLSFSNPAISCLRCNSMCLRCTLPRRTPHVAPTPFATIVTPPTYRSVILIPAATLAVYHAVLVVLDASLPTQATTIAFAAASSTSTVFSSLVVKILCWYFMFDIVTRCSHNTPPRLLVYYIFNRSRHTLQYKASSSSLPIIANIVFGEHFTSAMDSYFSV